MPKPKKYEQKEIYKIKSAEAYSSYSADKYSPDEVGRYSISNLGKVIKCNTTQFSQLLPDRKTIPVDLSKGLEDYIKEQDIVDETVSRNKENLSMLRWVCATKYDLEDKIHVIASRGVLRKIGCTLYEHFKTPWYYKFCKYQDRIYIYEEKLPEEENDKVIKYSGMGSMFEKHVTTSNEADNDTYRAYSVIKASIGKYNILMSAEIDAVRPKLVAIATENEKVNSSKTMENKDEYIEIKTCFEKSVDRKLSHGWLQSYLAGVDTLYVGFREESGIVSTTKEYKVSDIPAQASALWDGGAMFGLINGILNWVDSKLEDGTACTVNYCGVYKDVVLTRDGEQFLPPWFVYHVDNFDYLDYDEDLESF